MPGQTSTFAAWARRRTAVPLHGGARRRDRDALAGPLGARSTRSRRPTRPGPWPSPRRSAGRPKLFVLDMFPYPSGAGLHVGHPLGLHRHRRLRPLQAHDRLQRAAHAGLRRLRPARRAVRRPDRHPPAGQHRAEHRQHAAPAAAARAWPTTRAAASPPPTWATTAGRSGSSCRSSTAWYDADADRARPIAELVDELRATAPAPRPTGGRGRSSTPSSGAELVDDHRLAYLAEAPVNWCPGLGTVLANEEVTADGRSERGNFPVFKRNLRAVDDADHRLRRPPDRRPRPARLARRRSRPCSATGSGGPRAPRVDFPVDRRRRARSGSSRRGPTRCSAPPTWCWRPSTRWSTPLPPTAWPDGTPAAWTGGDATPARGGRGLPPPGRRPSDVERQAESRDKTGVFIGATRSTRSTASRSRSSSPTTC